MGISLTDIIPLAEYADALRIPLRTVQERASQGTLRHQGQNVAWLKGKRWLVYRHAKHYPRKSGRPNGKHQRA